ncbi:MAG: hypothetical protein JWN44_2469 [Myxococcales bacterium]|nr:hypothetical protein [Myxococcales bacterium]
MVATNPDALGIPFGKFHLLDRLGRGGMAEVWKAKALGPMGYARKLVVKRVLPELLADDEFVRMFVEEARLSASLNHRNIVQVYEFGEVGGEYYLAMEWVHGRDLNTLLRTLRDKSEEPSVGLAAYVGREVCRALGYAHALTDEEGTPLRLIHRDVSPSNVMLGFDGSVKLLDFGIAKAMAVASENRTQAGVLKGKFGYMSPEQVEAECEIDHRADLFVAGIVLWEMLTLKRLFKGQTEVQTISMVRSPKVVPPSMLNPAVPPELDVICMRALAASRDDRFADCGEMAAALDEVVHTLKFGSEHTARLVRRLFPNVPEPTQQLSLVPLHDRTPSNQPPATTTPTPKGEQIENAPTRILDVRPSAPTALRKALKLLAAPTLQRERRVVVVTAALIAVAGVVIAARRPVAAAPMTTAPIASAPWLTMPAAPAPAESPTRAAAIVAPLQAAAAATPALPPTVTIKLATRPAGASVTVEGEATPRGVTPLVLSLPRSPAVRRIVLSAPGHQRAVAEVTPDVDSRLYFELTRASARPRRHAAIARHLEPITPPAADEKEAFPPSAFRGIRGGD